MCGRYTLTYHDLGEVVAMLDATLDPAASALYQPRYNVAPTNAVVIATPGDHDGVTRPAIVPAVWGTTRNERLVINVRSENAGTVQLSRRCIVPADGFYEWVGEQRERRPIWFHAKDGGALFMAGVVHRSSEPGAPLTFAVLTRAAEAPVAAIHERMPVLLTADAARRWLTDEGGGRVRSDPVALVATPVSQRANSTAHDDPTCLEPATDAGEQLRLF